MGKEVLKEKMELNCSPLSEESYQISNDMLSTLECVKNESTITISFQLKEDNIWGNRGHEVAFGQTIIAKKINKNEDNSFYDSLTITIGKLNVGVSGTEFSVLFSGLHGGLVSYRYAGKEMIEAIPLPNFWRAPIDNDCGNKMPARYGQWKLASLYPYMKEFLGVKEEKQTATVGFLYELPTKPVSYVTVSYKVSMDGSVTTRMEYVPDKNNDLTPMPEFGMIMKLNADYDHIEWYGYGPEETYVDRWFGANICFHKCKAK